MKLIRARAFLSFVLALSVVFAPSAIASADVTPEGPDLPASLSLDDAHEDLPRARPRPPHRRRRREDGGRRGSDRGCRAEPRRHRQRRQRITWVQTYASGKDCSNDGALCNPWAYNIGINDSAAVADWLSGKRDLRLKVARTALAAAKMSRADASRTLTLQVKTAYLQAAQAQVAYAFAKEVAATEATTLKKFQDRYRKGAVNEGDLQRIEVEKLEADQTVDSARAALRQARAAIAFLLGVRGDTPEFDVDPKVLDYAQIDELKDATARRPDPSSARPSAGPGLGGLPAGFGRCADRARQASEDSRRDAGHRTTSGAASTGGRSTTPSRRRSSRSTYRPRSRSSTSFRASSVRPRPSETRASSSTRRRPRRS